MKSSNFAKIAGSWVCLRIIETSWLSNTFDNFSNIINKVRVKFYNVSQENQDKFWESCKSYEIKIANTDIKVIRLDQYNNMLYQDILSNNYRAALTLHYVDGGEGFRRVWLSDSQDRVSRVIFWEHKDEWLPDDDPKVISWLNFQNYSE